MPPLKRGKKSNDLNANRTKTKRAKERGVKSYFKPGKDRDEGTLKYIKLKTFKINDDHKDIFKKITNITRTLPKKMFITSGEGSVGGQRFALLQRPSLVNLCCELLGINLKQLMKTEDEAPYFMKKNGSIDVHQDIGFFANKRINTAIIYIKTTGLSTLKIYNKGYTDFHNDTDNKVIANIKQKDGLVVIFPAHLFHEVVVEKKDEKNENRAMIVLSYYVK